jgi:hypothetical protein
MLPILLGINDATMFEWLRLLAIIVFLIFCVCFTIGSGIAYLYKKIKNRNKKYFDNIN